MARVMDEQQTYTLHALQRMAERAVDESDIARALAGTLARRNDVAESWYAAGVTVVITLTGRVVTVIREVLDEHEPTRRRRGRN